MRVAAGVFFAGIAVAVFAAATVAAAADTADTIYSGGRILTMRGASPEYAESLAV